MNDLCEFGDGRGGPLSNGAARSSLSIIISFCKEKFPVPQYFYNGALRLRNVISKRSHPLISTPSGRPVMQAKHHKTPGVLPAGLLGPQSQPPPSPEARGLAMRDGPQRSWLIHLLIVCLEGDGASLSFLSWKQYMFSIGRKKKQTGSRNSQIKIGNCRVPRRSSPRTHQHAHVQRDWLVV